MKSAVNGHLLVLSWLLTQNGGTINVPRYYSYAVNCAFEDFYRAAQVSFLAQFIQVTSEKRCLFIETILLLIKPQLDDSYATDFVEFCDDRNVTAQIFLSARKHLKEHFFQQMMNHITYGTI